MLMILIYCLTLFIEKLLRLQQEFDTSQLEINKLKVENNNLRPLLSQVDELKSQLDREQLEVTRLRKDLQVKVDQITEAREELSQTRMKWQSALSGSTNKEMEMQSEQLREIERLQRIISTFEQRVDKDIATNEDLLRTTQQKLKEVPYHFRFSYFVYLKCYIIMNNIFIYL